MSNSKTPNKSKIIEAINGFNSRIFNVNNGEIPKNITGSINYIMLGKIFSFFKWKVSPQIRLNIKFSQFSISFQKKFE